MNLPSMRSKKATFYNQMTPFVHLELYLYLAICSQSSPVPFEPKKRKKPPFPSERPFQGGVLFRQEHRKCAFLSISFSIFESLKSKQFRRLKADADSKKDAATLPINYSTLSIVYRNIVKAIVIASSERHWMICSSLLTRLPFLL